MNLNGASKISKKVAQLATMINDFQIKPNDEPRKLHNLLHDHKIVS